MPTFSILNMEAVCCSDMLVPTYLIDYTVKQIRSARVPAILAKSVEFGFTERILLDKSVLIHELSKVSTAN
jgi:hypothetical protein